MENALWKLDHMHNYSSTHMKADKVNPRKDFHPGPHHHRLRGEMFATSFLQVLVDAIR